MIGLIKKDFLIIKSSMKMMAIIIILYVFMTIKEMYDFTIMIPFLSTVLLVSTFAYDDQSNWNAYACALPSGRKNMVKSKYLSAILIMILTAIISITISLITPYEKNTKDILTALSGTIFAVILIISLMYPLIFKFGSEKGRLWIFVLILGSAAIINYVSSFIDISFLKELLNITKKYIYIIIPIISLLLLSISYKISEKIFLKREF